MSIVLRDSFRSTAVTNEGRTVTCGFAFPCTNYSEQVFSTERDCFTVVVRIHRRCGATVAVGIIGDDQTVLCEKYIVGHPEIRPSLCCSVMNGQVQLRTNKLGRFFAGNCNIGDPADIQMCFNRGRLSFRVDDVHVNSDELAAIAFTGLYRVGVSVVERGQCAEIVRFTPGDTLLASVDQLRVFAGGVGPFPLEEYTGAGAFHFVDRARSIDIYKRGDQQEFVCRHSNHATVVSSEVFSKCQEVAESVAVTNLAGGGAAFGIIGHEHTANEGSYLGATELHDSIALWLMENEACIRFRDEVKARTRCDTSGRTLLRVTVNGGRLRFYVDMQEVDCPWLETVALDGRFRLGVSLGREGQRAEYEPLDAGLAAKQSILASGGLAAARAKATGTSRESNAKVMTLWELLGRFKRAHVTADSVRSGTITCQSSVAADKVMICGVLCGICVCGSLVAYLYAIRSLRRERPI